MTTYTKINTLYKRDTENKNVIIEGDYSKHEFENIRNWIFTEKIDGTNIRITYDFDKKDLKFDGKTDAAQIPAKLFAALSKMFSASMFETVFAPTANDPDKSFPHRIILFGEGYGAGIQNGGLYRADNGFILFDVLVDTWWLEYTNVSDIAEKLGIKVVPMLGIGPMEIGIKLVKNKMLSLASAQPRVFEGVVASSYPLMLFRDGQPIKWKLKVRDYADLGRVRDMN